MKLNRIAWFTRDEGETLAVFGAARLVKYLDGKIELRGGSPDDRRAAREWCSMLLHEAADIPKAKGCKPASCRNVSAIPSQSVNPMQTGWRK